MDDESIIGLFFARSEQAITELDAKYGKVCHRISYNILNDKRDAEECVNDAYLGTWNSIPPHKPNPLLAFLCKIVRRYAIMRYRENTALKRNSTYEIAMSEIEETLSSSASVEQEIEAKELACMIEIFLDSLSGINRAVFIRRYWYLDSYAEIAHQTGLTEKNVSVRLTRTRKQLRAYLLAKGVLV